MATTTSLGIIKPGVADPIDADLWGTQWNTNADTINTLIQTNIDAIANIAVASIGDFKISAQTADHSSWLLLNATVRDVSRATYAALFALLGTTWGTGDGSTTFGLPPAAGRFGLAAGGSFTIGDTGGASTQTLTTDNLPAHSHTVDARTGVGPVAGSGGPVAGATPSDTTINTSSVGSGTAFNILPPYAALGNAFIYSGV